MRVRLVARLGDYDLVVGARHPRTAGHARPPARQRAAELARRRTSTERPIPDLTSGFRAARREYLLEFLHLLPNGFSTPTTTTLAFIKAGYNVAFEPIAARAARRHVEDPARPRRRQVSADLAEGHHHLQPAAHLRARERGRVRARRGRTARGTSSITARIPNGAVLLLLFSILIMLVGLVSEQISTLRFEGRRCRNAESARPASRPTTSGTTCRSSSSELLAIADVSVHGDRRRLARRHRRGRRRARRGDPGRVHRAASHRPARPRAVVPRGHSPALATDADFVCQMDADLSHDPKYLPDLVAMAAARRRPRRSARATCKGVSVVNWPLRRLILSTFANWYVRTITGLRGARLHHRLPLLAPRGRSPRCRSTASSRTATRSCRVTVPGRSTPAATSARCRSSSSSAAWARRRCRAASCSSRCFTPWRCLGACGHGRIRSPRLRPARHVRAVGRCRA